MNFRKFMKYFKTDILKNISEVYFWDYLEKPPFLK